MSHGRRALLACLVLFALFTYFWRLGTAAWIPDEVIYSDAGRAYLAGNLAPNGEHPPLAKYLFGIAQLIVAENPLAVRLVAGVCGVAIAAGVFVLGRRMAGFGAGAVACSAWLLIPHALRGDELGPQVSKLDRFAMLDIVAGALMLGALLLGWRWMSSGRWWPAVGAGVMVGLAMAAKLPGALAMPPILLGGLLFQSDGRRVSRERLAQAGGVVGAAAAAFLLTWAPYGGDAGRAIGYMVSFQADHATDGHRILLAGETYDHAPWWAHLWFHWGHDGPGVSIALAVLALTGLALGPRRSAIYLGAAVLAPLVALSASPVALPHYRFIWLPPLVVLAALGFVALMKKARWGWALAVVAAVPIVLSGASDTVDLVHLEPEGYAIVAERLEGCVGEGEAVVLRGYRSVLNAYLPSADLRRSFPQEGNVSAVVLDPKVTSRSPAPEVSAEAQRRGFVRDDVGELEMWWPQEATGRCGAMD